MTVNSKFNSSPASRWEALKKRSDYLFERKKSTYPLGFLSPQTESWGVPQFLLGQRDVDLTSMTPLFREDGLSGTGNEPFHDPMKLRTACIVLISPRDIENPVHGFLRP